ISRLIWLHILFDNLLENRNVQKVYTTNLSGGQNTCPIADPELLRQPGLKIPG
ncbi:hypothetical protein ACJX0J_022387, partial [Zea mays]